MQEHGYKINKVFQYFPNKQEDSVRIRYQQLRSGQTKPTISIMPIEVVESGQVPVDDDEDSVSTFPRTLRWSTEEDQVLYDKLNEYGENWVEISKFLKTRTPHSIKSRWKSLCSGAPTNATYEDHPWSEDEDALLQEKYNECGPRWIDISAYFPDRNFVSVKKRYYFISKGIQSTTPKRTEISAWTKEEDQKLIDAISKIGCKYHELQTMFPNRSKAQIKTHWNNDLKPHNRHILSMFIASQQKGKNVWTPEENEILREGKQRGLSAKELMKQLPGRSTNQINNHWSKINEKNSIGKPMRSRRRSREEDSEDSDSSTEDEEEEEEEEEEDATSTSENVD